MNAKLMNGRELAEAIGKSEWWVCCARKAGLPFFCGSITYDMAIGWMMANPNFKAAAYTARGLEGHLRKPVSRPVKAAGKSGGKAGKSGQRIALLEPQEHQREQVA